MRTRLEVFQSRRLGRCKITTVVFIPMATMTETLLAAKAASGLSFAQLASRSPSRAFQQGAIKASTSIWRGSPPSGSGTKVLACRRLSSWGKQRPGGSAPIQPESPPTKWSCSCRVSSQRSSPRLLASRVTPVSDKGAGERPHGLVGAVARLWRESFCSLPSGLSNLCHRV